MGKIKEETYYDVLKVDPKATIAEIVSAYHAAKNAFSKDSVATYSLFSAEESEAILKKLDEAYAALSNIDRKRAYDQSLAHKAHGHEPKQTLTELELKQHAERQASPKGKEESAPRVVDASPIETPSDGKINGAFFLFIREARGLSVDEVGRATKIPSRFIKALEQENLPQFPARVYLQGFIKSLAHYYKVDSNKIVQGFFQWYEEKTTDPDSKKKAS